jgi:putative glycosyltransferase (TIGR04348 family)
MQKPSVVIVSPALAAANNGNWQTARRWAGFLGEKYRIRITQHWPDGTASAHDQVMLALHARRSADSVAAWAQAHPQRGLAVVLTGTDLYRDIAVDASAQASLALAQRLVVLQTLGLQSLPAQHQAKAMAIFQSVPTRQTLPKTTRHLRVVMVGHLRAEKSPQTLFEAAHLLRDEPGILIDHIGAASDPALGQQAQATAAACPHYRWLGGLAHTATRGHIQRAHLLVHTSAMEGGAHVVMEAVCSGTPVLASHIEGNVGMLGADYAGYFDWGDAPGLASLLRACAKAPTPNPHSHLLATLQAQCARRAPLFAPQAEQAALLKLVDELIQEPS